MTNILLKKDIALMKLFYNFKIPTYVEIMEILNENVGYSHNRKSKLIDSVIKRRLITENI